MTIGVKENSSTSAKYVATTLVDGIHYPIYANNIVSSGNSTTTALDDTEVFTGSWEDVGHFSDVVVAVKTDQNGVYTIQFSPDGVNADSTLTRYYRTSQIEPPHRFAITRRYCRVVFTNNSGSNQTYLRLQTIFGEKSDLNIPCDATMSQDYDAIAVRPTDYATEVALGRRQGAGNWHKWGYNTDVDTGGQETVWSVGGRFTPLTTASTFTIAYDGTGGGTTDGAGTNGATVLGFWYIDANRDAQYSTHTLETDGSDVTTFSGLGINRCKVISAGSGRVNASAITITATTGGTTQAQIPAGEGVTQHAFYFTPRNSQGLIDWAHFNVVKIGAGSQPTVIIRAWMKDYINNVDSEILRESIDTSVENNFDIKPPRAFTIPESSLIEFTAETDIDNTQVSIRFNLNQVQDVDG